MDEWALANGSTFIARGAGAGIAGEPLDLLVIDDPFKNRQEADSPTIQERVYEWYMDDVTPRIQERGAVILIHTRWNAGDLIGRIQESEEAPEWRFVVLKALAGDDDPLGRAPGEALCPARFTREKLEEKQRVEGVGFESLYQQDPIPRGGQFFQRAWFGEPVERVQVHRFEPSFDATYLLRRRGGGNGVTELDVRGGVHGATVPRFWWWHIHPAPGLHRTTLARRRKSRSGRASLDPHTRRTRDR